MRLLLLFDLPMNTKKEVKVYTKFRKYLIENGYIMMQFSVYCKLFANREAVVKHVEILKRNVPKDGQIRIMMITEKQYTKMEVITGCISDREAIINAEEFVIL